MNTDNLGELRDDDLHRELRKVYEPPTFVSDGDALTADN